MRLSSTTVCVAVNVVVARLSLSFSLLMHIPNSHMDNGTAPRPYKFTSLGIHLYALIRLEIRSLLNGSAFSFIRKYAGREREGIKILDVPAACALVDRKLRLV